MATDNPCPRDTALADADADADNIDAASPSSPTKRSRGHSSMSDSSREFGRQISDRLASLYHGRMC